MTYAIVIYPELGDDSEIQNFRKKYDPYFDLITPHLTIVFPFRDIERNKIRKHLLKIVNRFGKFDLRLKGIKKSFDNWVFLTVGEGNDELIRLHDALYTGILEKELRKDIEFIPHIGLGLFENDEKYREGEKEAKYLNLDYKCNISKVYLIELNDDMSKIDWTEEYSLV